MARRKEYCISGTADQQQADRASVVEAILPANGSDADEPPDQVELAGTSKAVKLIGVDTSGWPTLSSKAIRLTEVATSIWPAKCLKGACHLPSSACSACPHGQVSMEDVQALLERFKDHSPEPLKMVNVMGDGRRAAQYEVHEVAPNCRGSRAMKEPRVSSGRMDY